MMQRVRLVIVAIRVWYAEDSHVPWPSKMTLPPTFIPLSSMLLSLCYVNTSSSESTRNFPRFLHHCVIS